jgi:NADH-quinone oxidoreductase subunit A
MTINPYVPIVGLLILGALFALFSVSIAPIVGPKRYNRAKLEAYECGIEPAPQPIGGGRFPVKFYLTAMTFIIFDIEIVFLIPWAISLDALGLFGFVAVLIFIVAITLAYVYEWARGGLSWD